MSWSKTACPICQQGLHIVGGESSSGGEAWKFACENCGEYIVSGSLYDEVENNLRSDLSPAQRAVLAHHIHKKAFPAHSVGLPFPFINSRNLDEMFSGRAPILPIPPVQGQNLIKLVGNYQNETGSPLKLRARQLPAKIGCINVRQAINVIDEVSANGLIDKNVIGNSIGRVYSDLRLTFSGWDYWERLKQGKTGSKNGFIAMQFNDERLDKLISEVIRPAIKEQIGVELVRVDSPGTARAGLIDNVMRDAIESAAFVLVELSHGNHGAYWEAGLAEGLGKPVIYLCEQVVFDDPDRRPHFDVNHRTTIMWEEDKPDEFINVLIPTIRTTLRHHYPDNQETLPE